MIKTIDKRKLLATALVGFFSFLLAFFIDNYYIKGKGVIFLLEIFGLK
jgi:hypothetical protein